jgi:hypothetical protein
MVSALTEPPSDADQSPLGPSNLAWELLVPNARADLGRGVMPHDLDRARGGEDCDIGERLEQRARSEPVVPVPVRNEHVLE